MNAFDIFLKFVPDLKPLLEGNDVAEIQINAEAVFTERCGVVLREPLRLDQGRLYDACKTVAWHYAQQELEVNPIVDLRLPDGSRVAIVVPPVSQDGITVTIRRHQRRYFSLGALVDAEMMTEDVAGVLESAVLRKMNVLISGQPGVGKTTLLNAMANCIPADQRVIIIEDTTEIQVPHENQRRFEAKVGSVSMRQLLAASLRHSPGRLLLGEIRGAEAFDLMQLLNTGSAGSMCTLHASSAYLALRRFSSCVLMAGIDIPYRAIRSDISDSIQLIVHLARDGDGKRQVCELVKMVGYDSDVDRYQLEELHMLAANDRMLLPA